MRGLADDEHDFVRTQSSSDVVNGRENEEFLIAVTLLTDARERRSGGVKALPKIRLDFLAPRIVKHDFGAIADGGSHVLDVTVVPSAVCPPMQVPTTFFEPGNEGDVGARDIAVRRAEVGCDLFRRQALKGIRANRQRRQVE